MSRYPDAEELIDAQGMAELLALLSAIQGSGDQRRAQASVKVGGAGRRREPVGQGPRWTSAGPTGVTDTWDDDMPGPSEDPRNRCPKCDSVSMAPADGSGRWCPQCGWLWLIGVPGGEYMDLGKPDGSVGGQ